jgi:hypothetical protein
MHGNLVSTYRLADASVSTTVGQLASDIHQWLLSRKELVPQRGQLSGRPLHLAVESIVDGSVSALELLPLEATLGDVDLYNRRHRLVVTMLPPTVPLGQQRFEQQQGANSASDGHQDREHIAMLNNVLGNKSDNLSSPNANLPLQSRDYTKLDKHLKAISQRPQRVCFNCMYMMYPATDNSQILRVPASELPNGKHSCRAYRVAQHFIEAEVTRLGAENEQEVFLCELADDRATRSVYSCTTCKHERSRSAATYDLFDGVDATNTFTCRGLGTPVDPEFACLNTDERLALSVLKMVDKTFSAYAGYGYMSYKGGSMLDVNDYSGLAALLVSNPEHASANEAKMRAALQKLREYDNEMVNNLLTCLERELDHPHVDDAFPEAAGRGGLPMLSQTDADAAAMAAIADGGTGEDALPVGNAVSQCAVRVLHSQRVGGIFQTVDELDVSATHDGNHPHNQTQGTLRSRVDQGRHVTQQPVISRSACTAQDAALHTTFRGVL